MRMVLVRGFKAGRGRLEAWGVIFLFMVTGAQLLISGVQAAPTSQVVSAAELVDVARAALLRQVPKSVQAELEVVSAFAVTVPAGRITLTAVEPERILPVTSVRVEILVDGRRHRTVYVAFRVKLFATVVVSTQPLARGQTVEKGAVRLERREVTTVTGTYLTDLSEAVGKRVERSMGAGAVVTAEALSAPLAVERGKPLRIVVAVGQIRITALGKALEDGRVGDLVAVQVAATGKRIMAVVVGPGTVSLPSL